MIISFSPRLNYFDRLTASKDGDTLTLNGTQIDLSVIPDGATLPATAIDNEWVAGLVERIDGVLHVTLILPHGANPSRAVAFPEPITVTADGPIATPQDDEASHDD